MRLRSEQLYTPPELLSEPPDSYEEGRHGPELETRDSLCSAIADRIEVLPDNAAADDKDQAYAFQYEADDHYLTLANRQENGRQYTYTASISEFMNAPPKGQDPQHELDARKTKMEIAKQYLADKPELTNNWWHHLEATSQYIDNPEKQLANPTDQLIVGQDGRNIRFLNYGEPMEQQMQEDCWRYVDIMTQYFGDRTYDLVSDVVFAPLANKQDGSPIPGGFVVGNTSGVFFIDSNIEQKWSFKNPKIEDGNHRLEVMVHESGHLLHGMYEKDAEGLLKFAEGIGWDVDGLKKNAPLWKYNNHEDFKKARAYAPINKYVVLQEDNTKQALTYDEYDTTYNNDAYRKDGQDLRPVAVSGLGSPTAYSETNPREAFAETTSHSLLSDHVPQFLPETRDAWLAHAQNRILQPGEEPEDWPIATRLDRPPITWEYRTGDDILFPATKLPDVIKVHAIEEGEQYYDDSDDSDSADYHDDEYDDYDDDDYYEEEFPQ